MAREGFGIELAAAAHGAEPFATDDVFFVRGPGHWRLWLMPTLKLAVLFGSQSRSVTAPVAASSAEAARLGAGAGAAPVWDETRLPNLVIRAVAERPRRAASARSCSSWCPGIERTAGRPDQVANKHEAETRLKPLLALFIVCVIDVLGFGILIPLIPYMAAQFGASPTLNTSILGIYSACQLLAAPLWGRLSDRYGRRPILLTSMLGACCFLCDARLCALAGGTVPGARAGRIHGRQSVGGHGLCVRHQQAGGSRHDHGHVGAAIGIGFMLGPAIGGALAGEQLQAANFLRPALVSACTERAGDAAGAVHAAGEPPRASSAQ